MFFSRLKNIPFTVLILIHSKEFSDFKCKCKKTEQDFVLLKTRQRFFNKFWNLGNYNAQINFLGGFVSETEITLTTRKKHFKRKYRIEGYEVCRDMFFQTFKICSTRTSTAVQKSHSRNPFLGQKGTRQELIALWMNKNKN